MEEAGPLERAQLALQLLAVDPAGLGGLTLRARSGPVRDALLCDLSALPGPVARIPPTATDEWLFGGMDITATLAARQVVRRSGVLDRAALLILPMAERLAPELAARLGQVLDVGAHCILALDEGIDDEALAPALQERLAFCVALDGVPMAGAVDARMPDIAAARVLLPLVRETPDQLTQLTVLAERLGISSLRALQFAQRTARAHAAVSGRQHVADDDILAAVALALAHRATRLPENAEDDTPPPPPGDDQNDQNESDENTDIPDDILLAAVKAALPAGLLDRLESSAARRGSGAGSGSRRKGNRRGRPLPARKGRLDARARLDLVATLRAAAPWQTIRRRNAPDRTGLLVQPSDIHVKRYEQKSDRLLIFTVDASGSAALARLAEAKGAVELLLSEAYARRDHVALVAFRGAVADLLLPPTRSLVQTKRRLAALPGGGGTPLAAGLQAAFELALTSRGHGLTPTIVLLTDGRANIALDGQPDRPRAANDATRIARAIMGQRIETLVIDTGNRAEPALRELSKALAGSYLPLPRADARRLSQSVSAALES